MNPLPAEFTHDGFKFRQFARQLDIVLLEKSQPGHSFVSYEVIIVQRHPARNIHGRQYPEREAMPRSEAWGVLGWSFIDLEDAKIQFGKLVNVSKNVDSLPAPFPADAPIST